MARKDHFWCTHAHVSKSRISPDAGQKTTTAAQKSLQQSKHAAAGADRSKAINHPPTPTMSHHHQPTPNDDDNSDDDQNGVIEGPDLNSSKSPLDKKLYRQILLRNGLRAILISDTLAMHHQDVFVDDEGEEEETEDPDKKNDDEDEDEDEDDDDNDGLRDAAAAMVVGAGYMYDPPEAQGLAHFLEHMLFLGTTKYPTENAYDAFLSKHGGSDNAYTEAEHTVYHLHIPQEKLMEALDMFAQFFVSPLLRDDAVDRELNAIESEFQLSKNSDNCRVGQLWGHTSGRKDGHPQFTFGWGNLESLREEPQRRGSKADEDDDEPVDIMHLLRDFYHRYYFAQNMRLVVVGGYPLDELQDRVVKYFSDIPALPRQEAPCYPITFQNGLSWDSKMDCPMSTLGLPFQPDESLLGRSVYKIVPVKERHSLSLVWQVPSQIGHWRSKPCDYLSHLLGHEAQGSLLATLKERGLATTCYVGIDELEFKSSHALFSLCLSLTVKGMEQWQEIVTLVYQYIGMLRYFATKDGGLPDWIFQELKQIHQVAYDYQDEETPEDLVENLADSISPHYQVPPKRILDYSDLLWDDKCDEGAVGELLDTYLTPGNMRIDLLSSQFGDGDGGDEPTTATTNGEQQQQMDKDDGHNFYPKGPPLIEPRFGTKYWVETLPPDVITNWTKMWEPQLPPPETKLALPPKNPFVPQNLVRKPLPPDDTHHPLLFASLKVAIKVGKKLSWFPASVTKYNSLSNQIQLSYEDEEQVQWHKVDASIEDLTKSQALLPGYEGTLDDRKTKFRVVALPKEGEDAVLKYGDETDDDELTFPPIPPPVPASRLPQLAYTSSSSASQPLLKLWHLQDRKFHRPIADLRVRVVCRDANQTPLVAACADLYCRLVMDAVSFTSYLALMAELECSLSSTDLGFVVRVHGFDDKLLDLFQELFGVLLTLLCCDTSTAKGNDNDNRDNLPLAVFRPGAYDDQLEVLQRAYANEGLKASKLSTNVRIRCLRPNSWSAHAKLEALKHELKSKAHFVEIISKLLGGGSSNGSIALEALYHGNITTEDAVKAGELILKLIGAPASKNNQNGLSKKKFPSLAVTKIPVKPADAVVVPTKDPTEPNGSVEVYFQVDKDNLKDRVMTDLIAHIMDEPFYDQVRTKDQFGYSVSCDSRWTDGIMGIYFKVVSSTKSVEEMVERIERFVKEQYEAIKQLSHTEVLEHIIGLAKNKLDMFNSMSEETDAYWDEIRDDRYDWQVNRNEALLLRSVTKEQILESYNAWLVNPKTRRRLVVGVVSDDHSDGSEQQKTQQSQTERSRLIDERVSNFHTKVKDRWGKVLFK